MLGARHRLVVTIVASWVFTGVVSTPMAFGAEYEILWSLPRSPGAPSAIGAWDGDGGPFVRLADVDEKGTAMVLDPQARDINIVGAAGSPIVRVSQLLAGSGDVPGRFGLMLSAGRFVVEVLRQDSNVLRVFDGAGKVLAERAISGARVLATSANGNILVGGVGSASDSELTAWAEYDESLAEVARFGAIPLSAVTYEEHRRVGIVRGPGFCLKVEALKATTAVPMKLVDGVIRFGNADELRSIARDGTITISSLPPARVHGSGLTWTTDWAVVSTVVSRDGRYYSLLDVPGHFELARWNVGALAKSVFGPPKLPPPRFLPIPEQQAIVGQEVAIQVRAEDESKEGLEIRPVGLPSGASLSQFGKRNAIIQWTPTAGDRGRHQVTLTATDKICGSASQVVTIVVE